MCGKSLVFFWKTISMAHKANVKMLTSMEIDIARHIQLSLILKFCLKFNYSYWMFVFFSFVSRHLPIKAFFYFETKINKYEFCFNKNLPQKRMKYLKNCISYFKSSTHAKISSKLKIFIFLGEFPPANSCHNRNENWKLKKNI